MVSRVSEQGDDRKKVAIRMLARRPVVVSGHVGHTYLVLEPHTVTCSCFPPGPGSSSHPSTWPLPRGLVWLALPAQ